MVDVVIIGAGPAGLSAAISCREWDLNVIVIDEFMKPGGRLLGQLHQEPDGQWWNGLEEAGKLEAQAAAIGVKMHMGMSVHHIERTEQSYVVHAGDQLIETSNLLIATGAAELPAPIRGWTLPGVMSIGAAQVMTNVHRVRVGKKGMIVGINVLSAAIARELQLAGIELSGMALPAKNATVQDAAHPQKVMEAMMRIAHLAPSAWMRLGSKLGRAAWIRKLVVQLYPNRGMKVWGIPIHLRKAVVRINGTQRVESVTVCDLTVDGEPVIGSEQIIEVDFVCIAGGLYPLAELAAIIGCPFRYLEELGGHVPVHNERMETPLSGLFVAGNITGIESAKVARAQGTLAGLSIVQRVLTEPSNPHQDPIRELAGEHVREKLESAVLEAMNNVKKVRTEATIQFHRNIERGREKMAEVAATYPDLT